MRPLLLSAALLVGGSLAGLLAGPSGCAAIEQEIAKNPTVWVADFEMAENVANTGAEALWPVVKAQLPAAQQAAAQADFDKAEETFQDALALQTSSLAAYQDGQSANWAQLVTDGTKAVDALVAIIDQYGGTLPMVGTAGATASSSPYTVARAKVEIRRIDVHRYYARYAH